MKLRTLFIPAMITVFLLLISCGQLVDPTVTTDEQSNNAISQPWGEARTQEDAGGNIYYLYNDGIWRYNSQKQDSNCVVEGVSSFVGGFCVHEDAIYYFSDNEILKTSLNRPDESATIVSKAMLDAFYDGFSDYRDYLGLKERIGNLLIMKDSGTGYLAYSFKTNEMLRLAEDAESIAILDDMIYFVDHAKRTFSLYRKPLYQPDAQPELLLGSGKTRSIEELGEGDDTYTNLAHPWVRSVYVEDDRLFFTQNNDEVWEYKEDGKHVRIEP